VLRLALIADCHVGNHARFGGPITAGLNLRCRIILDSIRKAAWLAADTRSELVILGDLFDTVTPTPQIVAAVGDALTRVSHVHMLVGNHDQVSLLNGDHALGPQSKMPNVTVYQSPDIMYAGTEEVWFVPFRPGDARAWLPGVLADLEAAADLVHRGVDAHRLEGRILALHLGLERAEIAPFMKGHYDAIPIGQLDELCKQFSITHVFAGNWHSRWEGRGPKSRAYLMQVGTLAPTGWDNLGARNYGTVALFSQGDVEIEEVVGPRFLTVKSDDDLAAAFLLREQHHVFVREFVADGRFPCPADEAKKFAGYEVARDKQETTIAVRTAATVARSASTMDEALVGFIAEMGLEDGIDRSAVLAQAKLYLAKETS